MYETNLFTNCISNPTSTSATENLKKHYSEEQRTVDCSLKPVQRSIVKHSIGTVVLHMHMGQQKTLSNLAVLHLDTSNYNGTGMSNSARNRMQFTEQTMIRVQKTLVQETQSSNFMKTQPQITLVRSKPCHQMHTARVMLKVKVSSRSPQRRTILKDLEHKCIITKK